MRDIRINRDTFFNKITLFLALVLIINGVFPQFQMLIFHGNVKIPSITVKMLLLFTLLISSLRKKIVFNNKFLLLWWYIFLLYTSIELFIFISKYGYSPSDILYGFNSYYFFLLIAPLIFLIKGTYKEITMRKKIIQIFIVLSALGLWQYISKNPILPTASNDSSFKVFSWNYYLSVRAFSLFDSGLSFGNFIALISGIVFSQFISEKRKLKSFILLLLVIATGYATLTRNVYLEILATLFTSYLITVKKTKKTGYLFFLSFLYGFIGLIFSSIASTIAALFNNYGSVLTNDDSLYMRQAEWASVKSLWFNNDLITNLFGTGLVQSNKVQSVSMGPIDNTFLAIGLHIGLIGLILWIIFMFNLCQRVFKAAVVYKNPFVIGVAAFWSTWILSGIYNINTVVYINVLIILFLNTYEQKNKNREMKIDRKVA